MRGILTKFTIFSVTTLNKLKFQLFYENTSNSQHWISEFSIKQTINFRQSQTFGEVNWVKSRKNLQAVAKFTKYLMKSQSSQIKSANLLNKQANFWWNLKENCLDQQQNLAKTFEQIHQNFENICLLLQVAFFFLKHSQLTIWSN